MQSVDKAKRRVRIALGLATVLATQMLPCAEVLAQISKEWGQCTGSEGLNANIIISGCTAVIDASQDTPNRIALALNNRGVALKAKGEFDRVLQDYNESLRLDPTRANSTTTVE